MTYVKFLEDLSVKNTQFRGIILDNNYLWQFGRGTKPFRLSFNRWSKITQVFLLEAFPLIVWREKPEGLKIQHPSETFQRDPDSNDETFELNVPAWCQSSYFRYMHGQVHFAPRARL